MQTTTLLIIGGGPGGYVAAIRAGQLGIQTTLIDVGNLGGTCLNIGCIPSKALIHASEQFHAMRAQSQQATLGINVASPTIDIARTVEWKDDIVKRLTGGVAALLKKHRVQVIKGWARIIDGKTIEVAQQQDAKPLRIACEHLLLATGSVPAPIACLPFGGSVISSTEALSPASLPSSLAVVGAGYIGLELGMTYSRLGVRVSVIEAQDRILPAYDAQLSAPVAQALGALQVDLHLSTSVRGLDEQSGDLLLQDAQGAQRRLSADKILVAVGRRPRIDGYGLESLGLDMQGAALRVDSQCRTSMRDVWAIGDLTGEPMLAHRAMAQGEMVAEIIAGHRREFIPASIPAVCFTEPEIVTAGLDPDQARAQGLEVLQGVFPFAANGRAMTLEAGAGFVRVVALRDDHRIVGWQAVGKGVAELATAFSQSLEMGMRLEDVGGTIHAHPSLGEAVQESALRALGHALHV